MNQDNQPRDHSAVQLALVSTGRLSGDVTLIREMLEEALADTLAGRTWRLLDTVDPMGTIMQLSAYADTLNVQLKAQGFLPPANDCCFNDPMGFMQDTAAFYGKIESLVIDGPVTVQ